MSDTKCAPSKKYKDGSCFTYDILQKMVIQYNKKIKNPSEHLDYNEPKPVLVKVIKEKLSNKCDNQICWLRELIVDKIVNKQILNSTFRPEGPEGKYDWLSTVDINKVLNQYTDVYDDFSYLGTLPYDFESLKILELHHKDLFDKYYNKGKTKLAMVINLDTHDMNGSHWVALYTDLKNKQVYFSDSGGVGPGIRIRKFINRIVKFIYNKMYPDDNLDINKILNLVKKKKNHNVLKKIMNIDIKYNNIQHQFNNSECGVYSINFITRLLAGEKQEDIINNVIKDEEMNKYRKLYFRN